MRTLCVHLSDRAGGQDRTGRKNWAGTLPGWAGAVDRKGRTGLDGQGLCCTCDVLCPIPSPIHPCPLSPSTCLFPPSSPSPLISSLPSYLFCGGGGGPHTCLDRSGGGFRAGQAGTEDMPCLPSLPLLLVAVHFGCSGAHGSAWPVLLFSVSFSLSLIPATLPCLHIHTYMYMPPYITHMPALFAFIYFSPCSYHAHSFSHLLLSPYIPLQTYFFIDTPLSISIHAWHGSSPPWGGK